MKREVVVCSLFREERSHVIDGKMWKHPLDKLVEWKMFLDKYWGCHLTKGSWCWNFWAVWCCHTAFLFFVTVKPQIVKLVTFLTPLLSKRETLFLKTWWDPDCKYVVSYRNEKTGKMHSHGWDSKDMRCCYSPIHGLCVGIVFCLYLSLLPKLETTVVCMCTSQSKQALQNTKK